MLNVLYSTIHEDSFNRINSYELTQAKIDTPKVSGEYCFWQFPNYNAFASPALGFLIWDSVPRFEDSGSALCLRFAWHTWCRNKTSFYSVQFLTNTSWDSLIKLEYRSYWIINEKTKKGHVCETVSPSSAILPHWGRLTYDVEQMLLTLGRSNGPNKGRLQANDLQFPTSLSASRGLAAKPGLRMAEVSANYRGTVLVIVVNL